MHCNLLFSSKPVIMHCNLLFSSKPVIMPCIFEGHEDKDKQNDSFAKCFVRVGILVSYFETRT
jgi:hypothetical protein